MMGDQTVGWRIRKSFEIAPGFRVNLGKQGFTSLSLGRRGTTLNFGKRGVTSTVSVPGTGVSYQHRFGGHTRKLQAKQHGGYLLIAGIVIIVYMLFR